MIYKYCFTFIMLNLHFMLHNELTKNMFENVD